MTERAMRKATKGELTVGRFVIPYRLYGSQGPELVCLNGVQQSMAMWQSFVQRFSSQYRIVLFDFPGQGKASVTSGPIQASLEEQVQILREVIAGVKVQEPTLCSASWGGVVALSFAARYPRLVKRLVLASLGTRPNKAMVDVISKGSRIEESKRADMAETLINCFGQYLPAHMKDKIYRQFCSMSREQLQAFCEHGLFVIATGSLGSVIDFRKIQAETILLNGERDAIIDLEDVVSLAAKIPHCSLKIVKGAGHFLHLEDENIFDVYSEVLPRP